MQVFYDKFSKNKISTDTGLTFCQRMISIRSNRIGHWTSQEKKEDTPMVQVGWLGITERQRTALANTHQVN